MHKKSLHLFPLTATLLCLAGSEALADELHVAVASNFKAAMSEIGRKFENQTGNSLVVSYASTGKHFAQIVNGAPFDAFLAADAERPRRLEAKGLAVAGSRFTYAVGTLVLWSPLEGRFKDGAAVLGEGEFRFLAIANPRTAPYGLAAEQVLSRLGVWEALQSRIVRGENVGQAYAYVQSGNAELGFVAMSQITAFDAGARGSLWEVPMDLHDPIEQQAVLLKDSDAARALVAFLRGEEAAAVIRAHGYALP